MPFYKKKLRYEEIAPVAQKFRQFLRTNAICVKELVEVNKPDEPIEIFLADNDIAQAIFRDYHNIYSFLVNSRYLFTSPMDEGHLALYFFRDAEGKHPTVTKTHVRLPKLSHLITLTPDDFFTLLNVVDTAKNTQSGDSLSLNPAACGLTSIESSTLAQFFTKLRTNYRLNDVYADRKWTSRTDIHLMAEQPPGRDTQLMAMQYLTATQNDDLVYFPLETAVDLELNLDEWQQISHEYCTPPGALNPKDIRR